ncbi:MAG: NADH-quinone oxidoreductase subunit J [Prevotellaceae bacterium]|jgi:NADH-quinone oxidoreductase subunit J|nr:NADH-quinone oxidoreductase subunit J [Prevotellaceae bacterium]
MFEQVIFYTLAAVIALFSILAVNSTKLIRSAVYLLFVLLSTAGLYLLLGYYYLFAVQIAVYAGGIMVLFIFAIFLTHKPNEKIKPEPIKQRLAAMVLSLAGITFCAAVILQNITRVISLSTKEISTKELGITLMGTEKFQYLLPFEAVSILLLACIVGAIMIARKRN